MKNCTLTLWRAVMAGWMIAVGGTVFLAVESKALGALLFGIGLFGIFTGNLNLFTGKVGFAVVRPASFCIDLAIIWLGNLLGTLLAGAAIRMTRIAPALIERAAGMCRTKLADGAISCFVLSVFCGFLMFYAASRYQTASDGVSRCVSVFLPVAVFILAGFEHCVANMYYFTLAGVWSGSALLRMLLMSLGNAAGAIVLSLSQKVIGELR